MKNDVQLYSQKKASRKASRVQKNTDAARDSTTAQKRKKLNSVLKQEWEPLINETKFT